MQLIPGAKEIKQLNSGPDQSLVFKRKTHNWSMLKVMVFSLEIRFCYIVPLPCKVFYFTLVKWFLMFDFVSVFGIESGDHLPTISQLLFVKYVTPTWPTVSQSSGYSLSSHCR